MARMPGKMPSSTPTTKTTGNSRPLAECMVIMTTQSSLGVVAVQVGVQGDLVQEAGQGGLLRRSPDSRMMEVSSSWTFSSRARSSTVFFSSSITA